MSDLDETYSQYAEAFLGNMIGEGDIPLRNILNISVLDYSPNSLNEVDRYLKLVYRNGVNTSSAEYQNVVVWCGAYIGEVIRRNAVIEYHWVHYEDHMKKKDPGLKNLIPYTLGTHALLVEAGNGYLTMPINKVARFLDEGEANNIHFYAAGDISRKKIRASLRAQQKTLTGALSLGGNSGSQVIKCRPYTISLGHFNFKQDRQPCVYSVIAVDSSLPI